MIVYFLAMNSKRCTTKRSIVIRVNRRHYEKSIKAFWEGYENFEKQNRNLWSWLASRIVA